MSRELLCRQIDKRVELRFHVGSVYRADGTFMADDSHRVLVLRQYVV